MPKYTTFCVVFYFVKKIYRKVIIHIYYIFIKNVDTKETTVVLSMDWKYVN